MDHNVDDPTAKKKDLLDLFHPNQEICTFPKTKPKIKPDAFDRYRPKPGKFMEYKISQTDTKLDHGTTRIHMKQTLAQYTDWPSDVEPPKAAPPPPKKKKKITYTHGRGPCWEFLHEIWARKAEALQKIYQAEAKIRQARTKVQKKKEMTGLHRILTTLVGPDWFQELAASQLAAIETLKQCIHQDIKDDTVDNVKHCMARLGLVLRPNEKQLRTCLSYCCECPVEFLLILYQILNPHRTEYSLTDRLLLSSVVHLTMRETLRELHVRIPSPPPTKKEKKVKIEAKVKKKTYPSPYLEPYTFKPEERKFKGIYKNNYKQYPESIYFSYIDDLRAQQEDYSAMLEALLDEDGILKIPDKRLTPEEDLVLEWQRAQKSYEKLNVTQAFKTPNLHRANIYPTCKHGMEDSGAEGEYDEDLVPVTGLAQTDDLVETEMNKTDMTISLELKVTSDYNENSEFIQQKFQYYLDIDESVQPTYVNCIDKAQKEFQESEHTFLIQGVSISRDGKPVYTISGIAQPTWIPPEQVIYEKRILEAQELYASMENKFLFSGVSLDRNGEPVYGIAAVLPVSHYDEHIKKAQDFFTFNPNLYILGGVSIDREGNPVYHIQATSGIRMCKCALLAAKKAAETRREVEEEFMTMARFQDEIKRRQDWEKELKNNLKEVEEETYQKMRVTHSSHHDWVVNRRIVTPCCMCKKAVEKFINEPRCTCERCMEDIKERRKVFIIEGTSLITGEAIRIVQGTGQMHECECLERYNKKVAEYEERKARHDAYKDLKSLNKKFIISGVTKGPDGKPIYILSGPIPKYTCSCPEKNRKEKERIRNMPEPLPHDRRFIIGGVKATPEGNIWIVNGVQPFPDCNCMTLYKKFMEQHKPCMDLYEAFIKKIQRDTQQYMAELEDTGYYPAEDETEQPEKKELEVQEQEIEVAPDDSVPENPDFPDRSKKMLLVDKDRPMLVPETIDSQNSKVVIYDPNNPEYLKVAPNKEKPKSYQTVTYSPDMPKFAIVQELGICGYIKQPEEEGEEVEDQEITLELEIKKKKKVCICDPDHGSNDDCKCAEKHKKKAEPPPRVYKRYILLDKIPCNYEVQMIILKQVLATMADDGFPLAKLPDCYLLPHFKLWWRWRCGIYISQKDRWELLAFSKKFWTHTDICHKRVNIPKLHLTKDEARKLDWSQASYVKQMTYDFNNSYYRKVRQAHISDGREYFPTMCDYDLPEKNFRDCYFSYVPYKEEESYASRPWYTHEYKEMRMARVCL